jgi:hypothetical protein
MEPSNSDISYEDAIFAWMADWQPDVRILKSQHPELEAVCSPRLNIN